MNTEVFLTTDRLLINPLKPRDNHFILELVNTDGWIKFIGNRNITSPDEATAYIQKIIDNPNTTYWTVKLKSDQTAIGLITLIQRDYLTHHDIGFAFLPNFTGNGYAWEAAAAVLKNVMCHLRLPHMLAITIPENRTSIKLLKKLGLQFEKEIEVEHEKLHVYGVSADKLSINELSASFFGIFTNTNHRRPDLNLLHAICIPEAMLISKTETKHTIYDLASFMEPRHKILTDGTLTQFEEHETLEQTTIINNIAQRYSGYQKSGCMEGKLFNQTGHKFLQFVKTSEGWKISSVIWEDDKS